MVNEAVIGVEVVGVGFGEVVVVWTIDDVATVVCVVVGVLEVPLDDVVASTVVVPVTDVV